ncbi:Lola, partial [Operophtera brumata]
MPTASKGVSTLIKNVLSQQFDKHPIIILKDVKYAELRAMMDYMYRGEVNISQDQLAALLKAAESLQIKGLSDNKPSRPPSRPAPAPPAAHPAAHPPRAPSPPPQVRDGSIDSREGSVSPTRRRKKARRMSDGAPEPPTNSNSNGCSRDAALCKEEAARDVEDLTMDEEAEDPPQAHNDVVRMHVCPSRYISSRDAALCKEEAARDVEDLTMDEEAEDPPQAHNDVVR